jgi:2-dehydro-3-deoxyphosphogluconate aldolase/(4S)-4-hydroxy-2-oxoglutarate aldolase
MSFSNQEIVTAMRTTGMIPVFYHPDVAVATSVVEAAYQGGVRVFEFTNRGANAFDVFKELLVYRTKYPNLMLGIGTVMDTATTRRFVDAGADFIVSPIMKQEMAVACKELGKLWIPGCGTLTEIVTAKELGAEVIKIFPGAVLGPGFVSAVMPVVPGLQLMPTGGVEPTKENLSAWFKAGVTCVGMGSQLFKKEIIEHQDWPLLQSKVSAAYKLIQEVRK